MRGWDEKENSFINNLYFISVSLVCVTFYSVSFFLFFSEFLLPSGAYLETIEGTVCVVTLQAWAPPGKDGCLGNEISHPVSLPTD